MKPISSRANYWHRYAIACLLALQATAHLAATSAWYRRGGQTVGRLLASRPVLGQGCLCPPYASRSWRQGAGQGRGAGGWPAGIAILPAVVFSKELFKEHPGEQPRQSDPACRPIRDHIAYAWEAHTMDTLMRHLQESYPVDRRSLPASPPVAAIFAHDDALYAGHVNHLLFEQIFASRSRGPLLVVVFGVAHPACRKELHKQRDVLVLESFKAWHGPYGPIPVSPLRDRVAQRMGAADIEVNGQAHAHEHSIEAALPYLQYHCGPELSILPIVVSHMDLATMDRIAESLAEILVGYIQEVGLRPGQDIIFLCSSDSSHYGKDFQNTFLGEGLLGHDHAVEADLKATDLLLGEVAPSKLHQFRQEKAVDKGWCGRYAVTFGMLTVEQIFRKMGGKLTGQLVAYSDTLSHRVRLPYGAWELGLTAPFHPDHWVGHLAVSFYSTEAAAPLSSQPFSSAMPAQQARSRRWGVAYGATELRESSPIWCWTSERSSQAM